MDRQYEPATADALRSLYNIKACDCCGFETDDLRLIRLSPWKPYRLPGMTAWVCPLCDDER